MTPTKTRPHKPMLEGSLLIPGSQLGCMDGIASVHHQQDILSRQAMMYRLTTGWSLAHMSLAMTPEHSATSGENSSLRSASVLISQCWLNGLVRFCLSLSKIVPERTITFLEAIYSYLRFAACVAVGMFGVYPMTVI